MAIIVRILRGHPRKQPRRYQQGQMTLFFAMTLMFLIGCMAFIINVGMFVKAKINLQNAVDAAAFAGAAVQARQLSHIAYMNWEMRNVYKEWMFKYYVLGQLANPRTDPRRVREYAESGELMNFKIPPFDPGDQFKDLYNLPSVCIHPTGSNLNICQIYTVPGLPRFQPLGLVGIDETQAQFMNSLVQEKANNCVERGDMNFKTALHWVYGTDSVVIPGAPQIATHRFGAWTKALELAFRVRNLEYLVNEAPAPRPLCANGFGCDSITNFHQEPGQIPLHERKVKAFWSAYRNLENNDQEENLKRTFKLTELSPTPMEIRSNSLSGALIPGSPPQPYNKYYLDLQVVMLNLVQFFTLFTPATTTGGAFGSTQQEGSCNNIKVGLPVPAYPFGFVKNPEFVTYYAVKGEAEYTGLFNPFSRATKMVAYAAAKPFGGRIGPQLFKVQDSEVRARTAVKRSFSYLSGVSVPDANYVPGRPMPSNPTFWVVNNSSNSGVVGGSPVNQGGAAGSAIKFSVPNLIYSLGNRTSMGNQGGTGSDIIQEIRSNEGAATEKAGLYSKDQFEALKSNLVYSSTNVGPQDIEDAINRVRAPTDYEGLNYLIPHRDPGQLYSSTPGVVPTSPVSNGSIGERYSLFAPLWGAGTLYQEPANLITTVEEFVRLNISSVDAYREALKSMAISVYSDSQNLRGSATGGGAPSDGRENNYIRAAQAIHDDYLGNSTPLTCGSIAGKFSYFFLGENSRVTNCRNPSNPVLDTPVLTEKLNLYWRQQLNSNPSFQTYHFTTYAPPMRRNGAAPPTVDESLQRELMSAYSPGTEYGANVDGTFPHPFAGLGSAVYDTFKMKRNFYSTKFIALQTLLGSFTSGFTTYSEGTDQPPADIAIENFTNKLDTRYIGGQLNTIKE